MRRVRRQTRSRLPVRKRAIRRLDDDAPDDEREVEVGGGSDEKSGDGQ